MTKLPSEGELVKQRDFYNLAADALLTNGNFRNDAHYLYGAVEIVAPDGQATTPGKFALNDYYTGEMAGYSAGSPDADLYKRALLTGSAILVFSFRNPQMQEYPFSYTACFPSLVNPYSTVGRTFYPHNHDVDPVTRVPFTKPPIPEWHENEPAIVRSEAANETLILDIAQDQQLQHLMETLRTV